MRLLNHERKITKQLTMSKRQKNLSKKNLIKLSFLIILTFSPILTQACEGGSIDTPITTIGDNTGSGAREYLSSNIGLSGTSEFTISLWVKMSSHALTSTIFTIGGDQFRLFFIYVDLGVIQFYTVQFVGGGGVFPTSPVGFLLPTPVEIKVDEWYQLITSVQRKTPTLSRASFFILNNKLQNIPLVVPNPVDFTYNWDLAPGDKINFGNYISGEPFKSIDGVVGTGVMLPIWVGDDLFNFVTHTYRKPILKDIWLLNFYSDHSYVYSSGGSSKVLTKSKGVPLDFQQFPVEDTDDKIYKFTSGKMMSVAQVSLPSESQDHSNTKSFYLKIKISVLPSTGSFTLIKFENTNSFEIKISKSGVFELWTGMNKIGDYIGISATAENSLKKLIISYSFSTEISGTKYISLNFEGTSSSLEATGVLAPGLNSVHEFSFDLGNPHSSWEGLEFSIAEFSLWTGSFQIVTSCSNCDHSAGFFYSERKQCLKCSGSMKRIFESGTSNMEMKCSGSIPTGYHQIYSLTSSASYVASKCTENPNFQNLVTPDPPLSPSTLCSPCDSSCFTCSGPGSAECLTCYTETNRYLQGTSCPLCLLQDGEYMDYPGKACLSCTAGCKSCSGGLANQCKSCDTSSNYFFCAGCSGAAPGEGTCVQCSSGQFWTGASCQGCHGSCSSCAGVNDNQCTACDSGLHRYLCEGCSGAVAGQGTCILCNNSPNSGGPGISHYWSGTTCETCDTSCETCDGGGANECLSCDSSAKKYLENGQCLLCDEINDQVFWTGTVCTTCDPSCDHCTGVSDAECVQCNTGNMFYELGGRCLKCQPDTEGSNQFWDSASLSCETCWEGCSTGKCTGPLEEDCTMPQIPDEPEEETKGEDINEIIKLEYIHWVLKISDTYDNRIQIEFDKNVTLSSLYHENPANLKKLFMLEIDNIKTSFINYKVTQVETLFLDFYINKSYEKTNLKVTITDPTSITHTKNSGEIIYLAKNSSSIKIPAFLNFESEKTDTIDTMVGSTVKVAVAVLIIGSMVANSASCFGMVMVFVLKMLQTIEFASLFLFFNVRYSNFLTNYLTMIYNSMNQELMENPILFIMEREKYAYARHFKGKITKAKIDPFFLEASGIESLLMVILWGLRLILMNYYKQDGKAQKNQAKKNSVKKKNKGKFFFKTILVPEKNAQKKMKPKSSQSNNVVVSFFYLAWINVMLLYYVDYIFIASVNALHFQDMLKLSSIEIISSIFSIWVIFAFTIEICLLFKDAISSKRVIFYSEINSRENKKKVIERALCEFYYEGLKKNKLKNNKFARVSNILDFIRFKVMVIFLVFFQNFGQLQVWLVLMVFLLYFVNLIYQQIKFGIFETVEFVLKVLKEIGMLSLLFMIFILTNTWIGEFETLKEITNFETIFLIGFSITIFFEVLSVVILSVMKIVKSCKKRKKKKRVTLPEVISKKKY